MKKLFTIFMALMVAMAFTVQADVAKDARKAREKQKKEKLKQLKKEKWVIFGSSNTLEVALLNHYAKLAELGDDAHEVVGTASNFKSKNIGRQMAANNAAFTYAQEAGGELKGKVVSDIYGSATDNEGEYDHFYAAFERGVEKEIRGEMKESFCLIHDNGNGTYEMQTFFIINEDGARAARKRALEAALEESELAKKNADAISSFINKQ